MSNGSRRVRRWVAEIIVTTFGMAVILTGSIIVAGALLFAISPTTFMDIAAHLPEAVQERLTRDLFAVRVADHLVFSIVCVMAIGAFLLWRGIKIVREMEQP